MNTHSMYEPPTSFHIVVYTDTFGAINHSTLNVVEHKCYSVVHLEPLSDGYTEGCTMYTGETNVFEAWVATRVKA